MLKEIILEPGYWIALTLLLAAGTLLMRSRILDFKFMALVFASQYVVHAAFAFGITSEIAIFCFGFWILFVGTLSTPVHALYHSTMSKFGPQPIDGAPATPGRSRAFAARMHGALDRAQRPWILTAKLFLLVYWSIRLITYPYITGALNLNVRLEAGQENRALFFLGLVVLPALGACVAQWIQKGYRFHLLDYAVLLIVVVGYLGSGSKAAILPIVLLYFGATAFYKKPFREMRISLLVAAVAGVVLAVRLFFYFPTDSPRTIVQALLYRVVANTDSLEYLKAIDKAPGDFPFAGLGALAPMFLKPFGLVYDYSPGVWLHGTRFEQWQGYGPNPGIVMDYFGNLGWFGLLVAVFAALYIAFFSRVGGAIGVSFIAIAHKIFVDVTLFELPFLFWAAVLVGLLLLLAVLPERIKPRHGDTTTRKPRWMRRTGKTVPDGTEPDHVSGEAAGTAVATKPGASSTS